MIGLLLSKLIRFSNFFIFLFALLLFFFNNNYSNITNNILSILPNSENKEILQAYNKYSNSKTILLSIKDTNSTTLDKLKQIENAISKIAGVELYNPISNSYLQNYRTKNILLLNNLDEKKLQNLNIKKELQKLHQELTNSFFPVIINKKDPLNIFTQKLSKNNLKIKNNHIFLEEYGFLSTFRLDKSINTLQEYKRVYSKINAITNKYQDIKVFSTIFYFVENSNAIKKDVNKIVVFAFSILLLLYIFILRNINLLVNTLTTLGTSAILATIIITSFYNEVSIFVLVFGLSISTVSIDYMFHHYMHGFYKNKHTSKKLNKEVLFGFLTTIIAFVAVSFISFTLIQQIAIFTIISLTISYLHFSFLYPKIGFILKDQRGFKDIGFKIRKKYFLIISIIIICFSPFIISFDTNLKNLDYQNTKLINLDMFFKEKLNQKNKLALLIEANSVEDLILKYEQIKIKLPILDSSLNNLISKSKLDTKKEFINSKIIQTIKYKLNKESKEIGFRENFFENAYTINTKQNYDLTEMTRLGIDFFEYKNKIFTPVTIDKNDYKKIKSLNFLKPLSMRLLFDNSLKKVKDEILFLGLISLFLIILMVLFITKKNFLFALNFLLFPLAVILTYSYFSSFNILHIFMMFIILAISIDYAIYSSKSLDLNTKKAILYSLLSTFAGFGVLIFSQINSLFSIGVIATIGILSIAFLLIFIKRSSQ